MSHSLDPSPDLAKEERCRELELELEQHKERFLQASRRGIEAFRTDLSIANWIGNYPAEAAAIAFFGGFCLAFAKPLDRVARPSLR